jgi:hypothetical protein
VRQDILPAGRNARWHCRTHNAGAFIGTKRVAADSVEWKQTRPEFSQTATATTASIAPAESGRANQDCRINTFHHKRNFSCQYVG